MDSEIERRQPTELERQETWDAHANDLIERYAGFTDAENLTDGEKIVALLSLVPMALNVVEEARDTIERLNEEAGRSARMRYDLEIVDDRFCDVYAGFPGDRGHPSLGRAIDGLREWRKKYGMDWK